MQGNANNACYNATTAIYQVYELCVCSTVSLVCWSCRGEGPSWYVPSCTVLECSANVPRTQIILVQYIHTHTYASHYHINIRRIGNEVRRMRNVARGKQKDLFPVSGLHVRRESPDSDDSTALGSRLLPTKKADCAKLNFLLLSRTCHWITPPPRSQEAIKT